MRHLTVCLMFKFEFSLCRKSVINVCLGNDSLATISFFVMGSFVLDALVRDLSMLNG